MYASRMAYIVFYQGKKVLEKLKTLPVDIAYVSEKQSYTIVYGDKDVEQTLKKQLKEIKGFKHVSPSNMFDENLNF